MPIISLPNYFLVAVLNHTFLVRLIGSCIGQKFIHNLKTCKGNRFVFLIFELMASKVRK